MVPTQDLPNSVQRYNLTHDEAFDIDVALQLKLMLGIPALLWPQDQPFSVTQAGLQTNQQEINACMHEKRNWLFCTTILEIGL